ncbi:hypothetical protein ACCI51_13615 [Microbulbifer echini]|uniref:Lipoprotein n=1 Tax=Microbulbifer echini TaxID=1529067 RepID=A0ABV4NRM8_9GAMM
MKYKLAGLTIAAIVLSGCASLMEETVMKRAPFDLNCDTKSMTIHQLDRRTYGASGCDRRATYILQGPCAGPGSLCTAIMNTVAENQ